ncbi:hypothetical protein C6W10_25995 [Plantactinospora sp. BB1]|nr:hypothetical protein C6W10_25995 [Plantactinospora sp. BB1]
MGEQPYKRKLIEVALPLEDINREAAREKSIRHGHPSTLHLWWARRPLAAARAVLFAQLVDDPSAHPDQFPTAEAQQAERERLFDIIRDLVKWENSNDERVLAKARAEIWKSCDGNPPPILDPFAGGGTIPLEAQRLGLEAHASDLNPVAVLINKALIEIPPKWAGMPPVFPGAAESKLGGWPGATGLAEDVRRYGQWMRDEAEKRIGHLYPKAKLPDGSEATVIAWIWARTVKCPNPACGIMMPLVRSWWLGKKKGKEAYVVPSVVNGRVEFSIGHDVRQAPTKEKDGTVRRTGAVCIGCSTSVPLAFIRDEGKAGRIGTQLMAIAAEGVRRRHYIAPYGDHAAMADVPMPSGVPDTDLPKQGLGFRVQAYGMKRHYQLFTKRQLLVLNLFSELVVEMREKVLRDFEEIETSNAFSNSSYASGEEYAKSLAVYGAFLVSRLADRSASLVPWDPGPTKETPSHVFTRQAISMLWDFAETNPLGTSAGNFSDGAVLVANAIHRLPAGPLAYASQENATNRQYSGLVVTTDPPYYDNVGYADLSDFFYVWLRRPLASVMPQLFGTLLTPKVDELIADPSRHGDDAAAAEWFERGFQSVFAQIGRQSLPNFPACVYYAFKQSENGADGEASTGWEKLLEGMLQAGWSVTGTWPVRTEWGNRMRSFESNALASSVVLACRRKSSAATAIDRNGLVSALRAELPVALRELQQGNVAPVDLAQAAIGPGMAVFSRYQRVAEQDGSTMSVRTALALINRVLADVLSEQEGDFDLDTRWCLKWFEARGFDEGPSGEAETLARAMNTSLAGLERARVARARAGKTVLVAPDELSDRYEPDRDDRASVWEAALHLSRRLEEQGVDSAATLMAKLDGRVDLDAVKELAYLLYSICERRKWSQTALRFNSLVTSWPDLVATKDRAWGATNAQGTFDFEGTL